MRTIPLGTSGMEVPTIAVGCMRINSLNKNEAERFVQTAIEKVHSQQYFRNFIS